MSEILKGIRNDEIWDVEMTNVYTLANCCFDTLNFSEEAILGIRGALQRLGRSIENEVVSIFHIQNVGLTNPGPRKYLCYVNAIVQCLLRVDATFAKYFKCRQRDDKCLRVADGFSQLIG
jgi:hypothetical protein